MIENCPECGEPGTMLVYGLPAPPLLRAVEAGRVSLGGCMIEPGLPDWFCPARHRWTDEDLDGRGLLLDEIVAECNAPPPPPTAHVGAGVVEWRAGESALTLVAPGASDEVAPFEPRTPVGEYAFVVSPDERYLALFIYSGDIDAEDHTHGFELFEVRPEFRHIGGLPAVPGRHGHPPVFSPDSRWLVGFVADGYRVRGTDQHFTDLFDKRSGARVTLDWASLRALHLPDQELHRVDVGVEMPVSSYPHEYMDWDTEDAVRFTAGDVVVLRMPWRQEIAVSLPPSAPVTGDRPPTDPYYSAFR
ncbi:hypothetical protein [Actinoplanes palleronii]|uniref:Uncharacterized protein n=1 Tax=Actinoplanes palleronii TaxID=113570 RepID=A0ABQ4BG49_9ACTN|nr:hypothetical protein [Actinoplanes palleronii]GIE69629.1 hypothetical protein Apa02nite_057370 [Actinoplanes palleronii]